MSDVLIAALQGDAVTRSRQDADRLAIHAAFGERSTLASPDSTTFTAEAIELVAARLARSGDERAASACHSAFELLRGVLSDPALTSSWDLRTERRLLLRAASFGMLADRPAQTRQLLAQLSGRPHLEAPTWGDRVELSALEVWLRLIRRQGWEDIDQVHELLGLLRSDQADQEPSYLAESAGDPLAAWSLVAWYHLVRAAEILAEYSEYGSISGRFDPTEQAQMHFSRAREAADQTGDGDTAFLAQLLELTTVRLVANSIWTAARGAGSRAQRFVEQLTARARPNPILDLLPPQRRALVEAGLIGTGRRSVVVSLPTSAGKTLVAEFRILQALDRYEEQQGWVAYTAPTRALVNQLTSRLRRDFGPLGVRVEQFSPALEVDSVEAEILRSSQEQPFRVVVTTPEKLDLLLRGGWTSDLGRPLTLVIVDEAHNLGHGTRGLKLELLLATVNREHRDASFMLLTPFVPNAEDIASWLDPSNNQAVELGLEWLPNDRVVGLVRRQPGAKRGDAIITAETLTTSAPSLHTDDPVLLAQGRPLGRTHSQLQSPGVLAAVAAQALEDRGSTVTLVQQPDHSWSLAKSLADSLTEATTDAYVSAVQRVLRTEYGEGYPLVELLERGVAVHHAGLSDDVRGMLEALAERGSLRHIVATTTLAQGINFPISNVVLASHQYPYGVDMPPEDFWNVAGRAGRADHGQPGIVLLSAPEATRAERLREYVQSATGDLASTLISMVREAIERHGHLDLARLSFYGNWSAFVQFIAHTYRMAGSEVFASQVEQVLRGTLGFRALRDQHPGWADALVQSVRRYSSELSGKPISLVDSTGFSWESVNATLARLSEAGLQDQQLGTELFDPDSQVLRDAIGVLLQVPELREQLVERLDAQESGGDFLSRVVKDWVAGRLLSDIALDYFSTTEEGAQRDPIKAMTRCCQRLFGSILPAISWGLSALQALNRAGDDEAIPDEQKDFASYVYYGVSSREAVALRLFGVPRGAAQKLAATLAEPGLSTGDLRARLVSADEETWRTALGDDGDAYYQAWHLVEGAA
jgi:hypothetical protein